MANYQLQNYWWCEVSKLASYLACLFRLFFIFFKGFCLRFFFFLDGKWGGLLSRLGATMISAYSRGWLPNFTTEPACRTDCCVRNPIRAKTIAAAPTRVMHIYFTPRSVYTHTCTHTYAPPHGHFMGCPIPPVDMRGRSTCAGLAKIQPTPIHFPRFCGGGAE